MSLDWVYPLDACAASGVLDYDAAADLLDQPSRFVGNPRFENLPTINTSLLPDGTKMKEGPKTDVFGNPNKNLVENPSWKKWLFGVLTTAAIGAGIFGLSKGKLKLPNMTKLKSFGANICNVIKKPFVYIASKFKKTP